MLVGHAIIRNACETNNLGIIWSTPTFMNFRKSVKDNIPLNMALEYKTTVNFLQQMLNGLAEKSGYTEVATVPWLPMGESAHLLMVEALTTYSPERCIACVYIKNHHYQIHNHTIPTLTIFGTAQEWGQDKIDIRTRWNNIDNAYEKIQNEIKEYPEWPFSLVIDGWSGHFDCSEKVVNYMACYINLATKARLNKDGSNKLNPVLLKNGFRVDLPVPRHENKPVIACKNIKSENVFLPWFFDKVSAEDDRSFASINWNAVTQIPAFVNDSGKVAPFIFNGISKLIPTDMGEDGITFNVKPILLDKIPSNFAVGAGVKLAQTSGVPSLEWVCGQYMPVGENKFRISLDRSWPFTANYLGVRQVGNDSVRAVFQPCGLTLPKNSEGKFQKINFVPIPDVIVGTKSVPLAATSDAGLTVEFYVVAGPAIVKEGRLVFTKIPPRTRYPLAVTVAAWQWGRKTNPKVKMAEILTQTFYILKAKN
jgi:hypothetical protein